LKRTQSNDWLRQEAPEGLKLLPQLASSIGESYQHHRVRIYDVILRFVSGEISGLSNGDLIYESKVAKLLE
jgi:hypothetical protein